MNELKKPQRIVLITLCTLTSVSFLFVYYHICNDRYDLNMFVRTLFTAAISFTAYFFLSKYNEFLEKHYIKIVAAFLGTMLILQIIFGYFLEITPQFDFENIYKGAISWAETGTFPNPGDYYFYFPNNLGGLWLLSIVFRIVGIFQIENYYMAATVTNALMNVTMMLLCFCICRKLASIKTGLFILFIFMVSLPSYFGASVFYTDVLTMLFPVLFYYLYLKFRETTDLKWQVLFLVLMGLTAWVGMSIKFTVVIITVAIAIELVLRLEFKRLLLGVVVVAAVYMVCNACFYHMIYSDHLDQETAENMKLPPTHWIMMGLQGDGDYNGEDAAFSGSFDDPDERKDAIFEKIKQRISDYGAAGLFDLATRKAVKYFSDGTYELNAFFGHGMVKDTVLNDYITAEGEHYEQYQTFCTGVFLGFIFLMAIGGFGNLYQYKKGDFASLPYITPLLAVFGIMLFLTMWETHPRYITNYIPFIYICAATGMEFLSKIRIRMFLK